MAVDIEEIFPILLAAQAPVVALAVGRFFPNRDPQREIMPCVIWQRLGGAPVRPLEGRSATRYAIFRLESWSAVSQQQARQLSRAVQDIERGPELVGSWWVQKLTVNQGSDQDEPQVPTHADDLGLFCSVCEFTVFYKLG